MQTKTALLENTIKKLFSCEIDEFYKAQDLAEKLEIDFDKVASEIVFQIRMCNLEVNPVEVVLNFFIEEMSKVIPEAENVRVEKVNDRFVFVCDVFTKKRIIFQTSKENKIDRKIIFLIKNLMVTG